MADSRSLTLDRKCLNLLLRQINTLESVAMVTDTLANWLQDANPDSIDIVGENMAVLCVLVNQQIDKGLTTVEPISRCQNQQDVATDARHTQKEIHKKIINSVIIPLVKSLNNMSLPRSDASKLFNSIFTIVSDLCSDPSCLSDLVNVLYQLVKESITDSTFSHCADHQSESVVVLRHIELLAKIFRKCGQNSPWYTQYREELLRETTRAMLNADDKVVGRIFDSLVPALIGDTLQERDVNLIWDTVLKCYHDTCSSSVRQSTSLQRERPIFLVCSLADIFFPAAGFPSAVLTLLLGPGFWQILQSGFHHSSSLTRKRAMYLLKRLLDVINTQNIELLPEGNTCPLFWWSHSQKAKLSEMWMNFILLAETLEEKQIHVIRPLMPRFQLLVDASSIIIEGQKTLLHTSWLLSLAQRAAAHDNCNVQRWIVQQILEIPFERCLFFSQGQKDFFSGPLIKMLSNSSLYHKPPDVLLGHPPPMAKSVITFFVNITESLDRENQVDFFNEFLKGLLAQSWGGGPLVYVVRGLAELHSRTLVKHSMIPVVRDLLLSPMSTLQASFRSAVQYYLMVFVMNCIDLDSVSLSDFCSLLACLRAGETWKRGTDFYKELANFLSEAATKNQLWSAERIQHNLSTVITSYACNCSDNDNNQDTLKLMFCQSYQIIRLLTLAYDAQIITTSKDSHHLQTLFAAILDVIHSMNSHAYLSLPKVHRSFILLTVLIQETDSIAFDKDNVLEKEVKEIVISSISAIVLFMQRQISEMTEVTPLSYVDIYCDLLQTIGSSFSKDLITSSHLMSLVEFCVNTAEKQKGDQTGLQSVYASIRILATLSMLLNTDSWQLSWAKKSLQFFGNWHIMQQLPKPQHKRSESGSKDMLSETQTWGRTASRFLCYQWMCIHAYLTYNHQHCSQEKHSSITMDDCLTSLDLMSSDDIIPVLQCIRHLFNYESEESKCHVINITWRKILELSRDSSFWSTFDVFLEMTFQPEVLSAHPDTCIGQCFSQLLKELFELGEEKAGVVCKMTNHLCTWALTNNDTIQKSTLYVDRLINAIMFGPVHSRGKRFVNEVIQFLFHQKKLPANQLLKSTYKCDAAPRVRVLSLLAALDPDDPVQKSFLHTFLHQLMMKYKEVAELSTYRNYINSLAHRQKHRILSALLILQGAVDEDHLPEVFKFLNQMLVTESQPSVRCMVEWFILLLINRWQHLMDTIWEALNEGSEKKPAYLCSLLTIVAHISKLDLDEESKIQCIDKGLRVVLPWCMAHQFNVRTFGQATLFSLWQVCKKNSIESLILRHNIIDSFIHFAKYNRTACKSTFKLMDNFFFTFHPLRDYSIETIVHTLPMLTCMTDEEWIPVSLFTEIDSGWQKDAYHVRLYNVSDELKHSKPGTWRVKNSAHDVEEETGDDVTNSDVQKKMIPWRMMLPETELNSEMLSEYSKKQHKTGKLVIVASLIDKVPNLGGLCRTAEIFGASEFVIGNLSYIDDQGFRSLSVSAHHWIPITEVFRSRLKDYLREMKLAGYTLVGAEQTAQSQCLTKFSFPERSLLLLGNEKEGIPVDLIQMLDACVEIPQQGIIRSLNVHVSGALLIWEYTRQQLLKTHNV